MRIVPWILRLYCNLVRAGYARNDWDSFQKYQNLILTEIIGKY